MRITTRLATAGESGFLSTPSLPHPADHYVMADGHLDEAAVRRDLRDHPCITFSSDDRADTLSFGVELLDRMARAMKRLAASSAEVSVPEEGTKKTSARRKYDRGRVTYVRVDIKRRGAGGFRVKLSTANPLDVVGRSEQFAGIYAQAYADNLVAIADSLAEQGTPVELVEGEGVAGVFEEARRRNDRLAASMRHVNCLRRVNGFCSPADPACEMYRNGRCLLEA